MSLSSWLSASWPMKHIYPWTSWVGGTGSRQRSLLSRVRREMCARKWSTPSKRPQKVVPALWLIVGLSGGGQREHVLSPLLDTILPRRDFFNWSAQKNIPKPLLGKHLIKPQVIFILYQFFYPRFELDERNISLLRILLTPSREKDWTPIEGPERGIMVCYLTPA